MKKQIVVMFVVWLFTACNLLDVNARQVRDYVVLTSKEMQSDKAWMKVVEVLSKRHKARPKTRGHRKRMSASPRKVSHKKLWHTDLPDCL